MNKILIKLKAARREIKETKTEKKGYNNYSNYKYFTPEQISELVWNASLNQNLFNKFDTIESEKYLKGILTIFDIDSDEKIIFEMVTDIPQITATNIAQQLGGTVTYTERYLKMTAYDIVDNNLDFDTKNFKKELKKLPELTPEHASWKSVIKALNDKYTIIDIQKKYKISRTNLQKLEHETN